jgi:hypothetical protein
MSISIKSIVSVVPSVLAAGGNPLAMNGMVLSDNPNIPTGKVLSFPTAESVADYFGSAFDSQNVGMLQGGPHGIAVATPAVLHGGALTLTWDEFKTYNGLIAIACDDFEVDVFDCSRLGFADVSESGATSFTEFLDKINNIYQVKSDGISLPTWSFVDGKVVATSHRRGSLAAIDYATGGGAAPPAPSPSAPRLAGNLAIALSLTEATGATITLGEDPAEPVNLPQIWIKNIVGVQPGQLITGLYIKPGTYLLQPDLTGDPTGHVWNISQSPYDWSTTDEEFNIEISTRETDIADVYFRGFTTSTKKPTELNFFRYNPEPLAAWLRGGTPATLAELQAIETGALAFLVQGAQLLAQDIDLSEASSFSAIADILNLAFTVDYFSYDSLRKCFVVDTKTSGVGAYSTLSYFDPPSIRGTLGYLLGLTEANGGTLSQGSDGVTPAQCMDALVIKSQNWVSFMMAHDPLLDDKKAFALWNSRRGGQFMYCPWDTDSTIVSGSGDEVNPAFARYLVNAGINGTTVQYLDPLASAFVMGCVASLDLTATEGRITFAFKQSDAGLLPTVADDVSAANAVANGVNFYGDWANANNTWKFFHEGKIFGPSLWIDNYVDAIALNAALQLAIMNLFVTAKRIPANEAGMARIRAACMDPINQFKNFGAIVPNTPLSEGQIAEVNNQAGLPIDRIIYAKGWYLQVLVPDAQTRQLRQSPPAKFWYTDGGAVHQLNLASIDIL